MNKNKSIFLILKKNKEEKFNFLEYSLKLINGEEIFGYEDILNKEDVISNFETLINDVNGLKNDKFFQKKKSEIFQNFALIYNEILNFDIGSSAKQFSNNINELGKKHINQIQGFFIEFDHYHKPKPMIQFYGKNFYNVLEGKAYPENDFYGENLGWCEGTISFEKLFKPIYDLEWLEEDYGLNELFYGFTDYIVSEIFIIFHKVLEIINNENLLNKENILSPNYFYIYEHGIEPYSLYVLES